YGVFLALYSWGIKSNSRQAIKPIGAMLLLSSLTTLLTPGTNAIYGYSVFLAAYYLPWRQSALLLALTLALELSAFIYLYSEYPIYLRIALFLTVALYINGILLRKDMHHRFIQERDQNKIEQLATIAERERIGRDLHDLLGHSLSSIALKAELAEKLLQAEDQTASAAEIKQVAKLARQALSEVRESVAGLKTKGLEAELKQLCEHLYTAGFNSQCSNQLGRISADVEASLILMLKEACTNIIRHSQGDQARLELLSQGRNIVLKVWDNGQAANIERGNGLAGMAERCQQLGGQLDISSSANGTELSLVLPLLEEA
ncbi:MAG: sensor histidine kinase, partial [Cellvibrionaceae bacterium]|nr:sensor histidine kinase [Cellvibrionaceae bacterium]